MVLKIIISLIIFLGIQDVKAESLMTERELLKEFEETYIGKINCNDDFYRCVQERKTAKEKYLAENQHRIKKQTKSDEQIKQEIINQYNYGKGQREIVTRQGNSFTQTIIKEEPKKNLDQVVAEGLIKGVTQIMGIDRMQEQIKQNNARHIENTNNLMRKISDKGDLCRYWIENQSKHPNGREFMQESCKY